MRTALFRTRPFALARPAVTAVLLIGVATRCTRKAAEAEAGRPLGLPVVTGLQAAADTVKPPFREVAPGVFMRTILRAPYSPGLNVEIQDLEVRPRQLTKQVTLAGAALLEIRSGRAIVTVGQVTKEVRVGAIFALPQGQALVLDNRADVPISIRLYVVTAQ